jgi:hypothetical protein
MEPIQAFPLGIMVALTPSLIILAVLLRDVRDAPSSNTDL